jgi:hypothetical protein
MLTRAMVLGLTSSALALLPLRAPDLPPQYLPMYGGNGGTAFTRSCGAGKVMTGVRYRTGLSLDAIGPLCRPVNASGTLGAEFAPSMAGGTGGTLGSARCAATDVVFSVRIYFGSFVDGARFGCARWLPATRQIGGYVNQLTVGRTVVNSGADANCAGSTQPAIALVGRAASLIDAIGMVCDEP